MPTWEEKIDRMRRIFRGQESYGEGTPAAQATRFRADEMLSEIVRRACANSDYQGRGVDFLISLSGYSPNTTILSYEILRPQKLLVVFSSTALNSVDVIADAVVGPGRLRHQDFMHEECDPTDPLGIYEIVREKLRRLRPSSPTRPHTIIDITGGKKVMSATAALAAWQLDLPLSYVDSEYDPELRQPVPGTERLILLSNPTELFGHHEMQGARQMFLAGAYEAARARYDDLSNRISEPTGARFMRDLSELYRAWCDLDLDSLPRCVDQIDKHLDDPRLNKILSSRLAGRLRAQVDFLRLLPSDELSLLPCFYVLGLHYAGIRRFDFAALLFHRTIEGCLAKRLELHRKGFRCQRPDYSLLLPDLDELARRYREVAATIRPGEGESALPPRVGLISAAALLVTLDDSLIGAAHLKTPEALQHLLRLAEIRNASVLAHGFKSIREEQSRVLQATALNVLRAFWNLHGIPSHVDALCENLQFINMDEEPIWA